MDIEFILKSLSQLFIALFIIALLLPLEKFFPAVSKRRVKKGRGVAILLIGIITALMMLGFFSYGQSGFITFLLSFQIIDVSRANVPDWVLVVGTILFIDFVSYCLHYISHHFFPLWRIHSVHHSDEHITALSTLLQHPLGALISATIHIFFAVLLGLPLLVFILYSFFAIVHGVFTHADVRLPTKLDKALRWIIVTPDLHRTHHSVDMQEGNSNFGIVFTIWDRMFGTYVDVPKTGVPDIIMGLPESEKPRSFSTLGLLLHPFRGSSTDQNLK